MNWKRVGIAGGALATFVVGVSVVAYATGRLTSEAGVLTTPIVLTTPPPSSSEIPAPSEVDPQVVKDAEAARAAQAQQSQAPTTTPTTPTSSTSNSGGGKTLSTITPANPISIKSLLGNSFSSLDNILKIGVPNLLISLAGLIMMVMFFINAIKFLFNAGNEGGTKDAKAGMLNAGIGFAIVLLAYATVAFINGIFK